MTELLTLITVLLFFLATALTFFFLGKWSTAPESLGEFKKTISTRMRELKARDIPTVITYPTRQDVEYENSEQKTIDDAIENNLKRAGLE